MTYAECEPGARPVWAVAAPVFGALWLAAPVVAFAVSGSASAPVHSTVPSKPDSSTFRSSSAA